MILPQRLEAEIREQLHHLGCLHRLLQLTVDARHRFRRHAGRPDQAVERIGVHVAEPGLDEGRHFGQRARTLRKCNREHPHLARLDDRQA
jgi:hypothetical protein